ncbi:MAG: LamG-like jellyroll fold domain-containing protein [Gemmataceae bacterium]
MPIQGLRVLIVLVALGTGLAMAVWTAAPQQPPASGMAPRFRWMLHEINPAAGTVPDTAGTLHGTLLGKPQRAAEPVPALILAGPDDGVLLRAEQLRGADLPTQNTTLTAMVRVDTTAEWGGILSCFQDNGSRERGIVIGHNEKNFFFGLATTGADDGDGFMTYLKSKSTFTLGQWVHLAATYDGKTMRLYINGQLDASSTEQSGPIDYAAKAPLVLGRYRDENEDFPLRGALREVSWFDRTLDAEQVQAHFAPEAERTRLAPINTMANLFAVQPYLQFGTPTTMTILCETREPATVEVQYGLTFPPTQKQAGAATAGTMHEVRLENLTGHTKYFYQVVVTPRGGSPITSRHSTFLTAVGPNDPYSFCVIGDTQANPVITGKVSKLMWERRPHFVLHCGDVVDDGASRRMWTDDLFKPCWELFGRVAVFPTIGNHEKNHPFYYQYFALPKPEYYYQYRYGNAEFFSVDSNSLRDLSPKGEQYRWLDDAMAKSTATWKIVYHHHPAYSSDSDDYGNTWKGGSTAGDPRLRDLAALYEKHKVDIVFNGHIHLYERSWPIRGGKVDLKNGVVHITSGGGGGKLEDFAPTPNTFKAESRVDYHFCYLTVHEGTLNFKAFDHEGRLFDTMTINK